MIRVTSRAGIFLALPLAMLAALALTRFRPRPVVLAGLFALALAETVIVPIPMPEWTKIIDSRREPPAVYKWLAAQPGRDPIIHLPMLDVYGLERRPAYHESVYMVYSTHHWKPLVNGYAGIEPASYRRMRALARGFPPRSSWPRCARSGCGTSCCTVAAMGRTSGRASSSRFPGSRAARTAHCARLRSFWKNGVGGKSLRGRAGRRRV